MSLLEDQVAIITGAGTGIGAATARAHYGCRGWTAHHNTDIWRGAAPINASDHGIWVTGSGWMAHHYWEHFLFGRDTTFLRNEAWPVMRDAALFYTDLLVPDPKTGWLVSCPSNSPENGGLVSGPTMDHQIIKSLFRACIEAGRILDSGDAFTDTLAAMLPRIAPYRIGRFGQLQEWMDDIDDPDNKHRHVSHLWGVHPGKEINWKDNPEFMEAAKKSLVARGDEGTGWSLAWKINFWARLLDGDHAHKLLVEARARLVSLVGFLWLASSLGLTAMVVVLALTGAHLRQMAHDALELGLVLFNRPNAIVFAVVVLALPVFAALGPLWLLAYLFGLSWAYLGRLQVVAAVGSCVVLALAGPTLEIWQQEALRLPPVGGTDPPSLNAPKIARMSERKIADARPPPTAARMTGSTTFGRC